MIEPQSLLALRFSTEVCVAVGDPKQLPPTITSGGAQQGSVGTADDSSLSKALFVRLATRFPPLLLATQYRCHPEIARLSNELFYDRKLRDGVTAADRAPVLSTLPPLCWCDSQGTRESKDNTGSFFNDGEVGATAAIVKALLDAGVSPSQIGVISTYAAQNQRLQQAVTSVADQFHPSPVVSPDVDDIKDTRLQSAVQVCTVDAFQVGRYLTALVLAG